MDTTFAERLDLAVGDEYHWWSVACQTIADAMMGKTGDILKIEGLRK